MRGRRARALIAVLGLAATVSFPLWVVPTRLCGVVLLRFLAASPTPHAATVCAGEPAACTQLTTAAEPSGTGAYVHTARYRQSVQSMPGPFQLRVVADGGAEIFAGSFRTPGCEVGSASGAGRTAAASTLVFVGDLGQTE